MHQLSGGSYRQKQVDNIEAVQRRAGQFIKNNSDRNFSVTLMQQSLSLDLSKHSSSEKILLAKKGSMSLPIHCYFYARPPHSELFKYNFSSNRGQTVIIIYVVIFQ
jgi:hypothetical protein